MIKRLKSYRQVGFTLLEVLVALAVLAIGLGALIEAASSSVSHLSYQRDRTLAAWVAENIATEIVLFDKLPRPGIKRGRQRMAKQEWVWEMNVQATDYPALYRLDISVGLASPRPNTDLNDLAQTHSEWVISRLSAFARAP